ncbi:MAG: peroxiredoxin [Alphaproteobacteria bacterium]|nr:peroxiredoxin [Alphaproteobacteria bacterium]
MTIKVGDKIPEGTLMQMTDKGPAPLTTAELFGGKKVVLFAVPGAFTPTCSNQHLPGFVEKASEIKAKGVSTIACLSVNDAFVMGAWGKDRNVGDKVLMLGDGSAAFSKALGLELDLTKMGLGVRSKRYSMLVEDGVVKQLNIEDAPGGAVKSGAETMLTQL